MQTITHCLGSAVTHAHVSTPLRKGQGQHLATSTSSPGSNVEIYFSIFCGRASSTAHSWNACVIPGSFPWSMPGFARSSDPIPEAFVNRRR